MKKIKYVGALFLGHYSPEVIGDYVAGPSHVLPTNQTARFSNGLTVNDFMTRNSVIQLTQKPLKRSRIQQNTLHILNLYIIMKSLFKYAIKEGHILIRIDKNESPIAPLSQVQLNEILKDMQYNLYPDEEYQRFREAYASFYKLNPNQVIAANGSDELIQN